MVSRILAWAVLCFAVSVLGAELLIYLETGGYAPLTLGQIWQGLDLRSYVGAENLIRNRISVGLWDPVLVTVLAIPAWALLAGISAFFFILALIRRR